LENKNILTSDFVQLGIMQSWFHGMCSYTVAENARTAAARLYYREEK